MNGTFYKYQGTGNDFVIIDNRQNNFPKNDTKLIAFLCDRKFGIGGDGLLLLENDDLSDFRMVYFNADGKEGSMCGNGGRCIVAFAHFLGIIGGATTFIAVDGLHEASITGTMVSLKMMDVTEIKVKPNAYFLNTGSPHHVQLVSNLSELDVPSEGARLRYGLYGKTGSNINFVSEKESDIFSIRTYERGVENETLSCGTGVTAVAIAMHYAGKTTSENVTVNALGGQLKVKFEHNNGVYSEIYLTGETKQIFKGEISW